MKKILGFVVMLICLISGCSCSEEEILRTSIVSPYITAYSNKDLNGKTYFVEPFGTSQMMLVGYNEKKVYKIEDKYNELVEKYHSLLDRNYYYVQNGEFINNVKVVNDSYGSGNSVVVDGIIIDILKKGIEYTKLSNGKFNIFSGSIVDLWDTRFDGFSSKYGVDPSENEVNEALNCVVNVNDIDDVLVIDEATSSVTFNSFEGCESGASITLGALAKSYFIDYIVSLEEFKKIGSAIYSAGQSSIILKGDNPTREKGIWSIGLNDSLNTNAFFSTQAVNLLLEGNKALSTSGGEYKGYVNENGIRRHHIIDATSGYPNNFLLGATVIGENAMICDIVTTTLMTMNSLEEIKDYLVLLETRGLYFDVLLQTELNNSLKIYVNPSMESNIGKINDGVILEVFTYGA